MTRNKAVADGGILHALDHRVTARMARFTYGTDGAVVYDDDNEEHVERNNLAYWDSYDYCMRLPGGFHTILLAVCQIASSNTLSYIIEGDASYRDTGIRLSRILYEEKACKHTDRLQM